MWVFLFELIGLSLFANFIAGTSKKNKGKQIGFRILQFILCFFVMVVSSFCFFSLSKIEDFRGILEGEITLYTIENIFYFALWLAVQLIISLLLGISLRAWNKRGIGKATQSLTKKWLAGIGSTLVLSWIFLIAVFSIKTTAETKLAINEICSNNESVLADDNGEYNDYIELFNPTHFNIDLSSFYISDNLDNQPKQISTGMTIEAGGYAIVKLGEGEQSFGISSSGGETLYLLNSNSDILDSVEVPQLDADTVYARSPVDMQWDIYFYPTPSQRNTTTKDKVGSPIFSVEAGFYESDFTLELSAVEDCDIYYTLDGSIPNQDSQLYTTGIEVKNVCDQPNVYRAIQNVVTDWSDYTPTDENVDKAFIIRAVAVDGDGNESDVTTKTYFVDMDEYKNQYVLSLVSDPEDLFGEDGIYVTGKEYDEWYIGEREGEKPTANFLQRGTNYEIETSIELFNNKLMMSQNAGMRIQGESTREYALKRLRLYSRKKYSGSRYFLYNFFGIKLHSVILNNSFQDAFLQSLVNDRDIGGTDSIQVSLFLDGEFWQNTFLRERYDEDFLAQKYNIKKQDIVIESKIPEDIYIFLKEHDLSTDKDYVEFGNIIDIQNYIDYIAYNIYLCNMDLSETKNIKLWKSDGYSGVDYDDGKWRFLIYDMDSITWNNSKNFYGIDSYGINSFSEDHQFAGVAFDQEAIFAELQKNEDFCRQFVLTFMDFANTYFEKSNVERQLNEWGYDLSWCDGFFEKRFDYIVPDLAEEFELTGTLEEITLKVNKIDAGDIEINTVTPDLSNGEWSGYYYTDYPVTITAEPAEGYEFVAWHHGDEIYMDQELEVELNEDDNLWEAEFVRTGD